MKEEFGDIWQLRSKLKADAVVITTNGFVKKNGEAVMGRGIALEAAKKYKDFPARLGNVITQFGNIVWPHEFDMWNGEADYQDLLITMPVKHNWWEKADIALIKESTQNLTWMADDLGIKTILVPRPGCGNGGLKWVDVKPIIEPYLDDRFVICHKES